MSISNTFLIVILIAAMSSPAEAQGTGKGSKQRAGSTLFKRLDTDKDGKISAKEAEGNRLARTFGELDRDNDGFLSRKEIAAGRQQRRGGKRRGGQDGDTQKGEEGGQDGARRSRRGGRNRGFRNSVFQGPDGRTLRYALLKPTGLEQGKRLPLVVALHGVGGRGKDKWVGNCFANGVLAKAAMRKKFPCFVLAPTVKKTEKWGGDPIVDLIALIEKLSKDLPIDADRIYITGQSMGGAGTYAAIFVKPDLFAAAVPVCGRSSVEDGVGLAKKIARVPIWSFCGDRDARVRVESNREIFKALKNAGGSPKYTEYPKVGHNAWTPTYNNEAVWTWMFEQKRIRTQERLPSAGQKKMATGEANSTAVRRPNVILVMTDHQGYGDLVFNGNTMINTPNMDALARQSERRKSGG